MAEVTMTREEYWAASREALDRALRLARPATAADIRRAHNALLRAGVPPWHWAVPVIPLQPVRIKKGRGGRRKRARRASAFRWIDNHGRAGEPGRRRAQSVLRTWRRNAHGGLLW
jgi:hypothetical protein